MSKFSVQSNWLFNNLSCNNLTVGGTINYLESYQTLERSGNIELNKKLIYIINNGELSDINLNNSDIIGQEKTIIVVKNDSNTIGKFSNFLLNKMRASDVDTIMLALESDADKNIIKQIESFSDEVKGG